MNVLARNYGFNIFVDNNDVTTDIHWISNAMNAFSHLQLIPSFGNEFNPLTSAKKNFLRMVTPDESIQVNINNQVTNIAINKNESPEVIEKILQDVLFGLAKLFPDKIANRIAIVTSSLLVGSTDDYEHAFNAIHHPIKEEGILFEWDSRIAFKVNVEGVEKNMNAITVIRRGMHALINQPIQDTLVVDTDLNTEHENQNFRFKYSDVNEKIHAMIEKSIVMRDSAYKLIGV